ncbi:MAG: hypothetical protein C4567_11040 [Deltaproteobacteria bacterium]|nr:MAG: hypothetical protein C4567_11040 [Deltaproteobacteria bacterium]
MAVLLAHEALQITAPGQIQIEAHRPAALPVPVAAVQGDAPSLPVFFPQEGTDHAGVASHHLPGAAHHGPPGVMRLRLFL